MYYVNDDISYGSSSNVSLTRRDNASATVTSRVPTPSKEKISRHEQVRKEALTILAYADHKKDPKVDGSHKGMGGERLIQTETGGILLSQSRLLLYGLELEVRRGRMGEK